MKDVLQRLTTLPQSGLFTNLPEPTFMQDDKVRELIRSTVSRPLSTELEKCYLEARFRAAPPYNSTVIADLIVYCPDSSFRKIDYHKDELKNLLNRINYHSAIVLPAKKAIEFHKNDKLPVVSPRKWLELCWMLDNTGSFSIHDNKKLG